MTQVLIIITLTLLACQVSFGCLFCKDLYPNGEKWRIATEAECLLPQQQYYFNCLLYIQCDKLSDGRYNASLKMCPQTSNSDLSGFDPEKTECSPDYKCVSVNNAGANEAVRIVPASECRDGWRIHESSCKHYYKCEEKQDGGKVKASLGSCEKDLGKSNVRFNPVLMACEEGAYSPNWECNKE